MISRQEILELLHEKIMFDLMGSREWIGVAGQKVLELTFDAVLARSRAAIACLWRSWKKPPRQGRCFCSYALDPCDQYSTSLLFESSLDRAVQ